jgi:hypothetical protein
MTPRQPKETSSDEVRTEIRQAVHEALTDTPPVGSPTDDHLLAQLKQSTAIKEPGTVDTTVEIDRTELYLRGPTAFTA